MFEIEFKREALAALRKMKSIRAQQVLDAVESHLRHEPERTSRTRIKRLRGKQRAVFRLRAGDYRVFYDVLEDVVSVVAVLHKDETPEFYAEGEGS
jgi:mRNA-degrading endonuclease RelE of RelBE toxin-antitoxin system